MNRVTKSSDNIPRQGEESSDDEEYNDNQIHFDGQHDELGVDDGSDGDSSAESAPEEVFNGNGTRTKAAGRQHEEKEEMGDTADDLRARIQSMPMGKVDELRKTLGVKLFNKTFFGEGSTATTSFLTNERSHSTAQNKMSKPNSEQDALRKRNPKQPREVSSKKPVSKYRRVVDLRKNDKFDPRFSADCGGDFDDTKFRKDYAFLNDLKRQEIMELKKAHRAARHEDPEKAARIKKNILRLENQQKSVKEANLMQEMRAELRNTNIERMNQGQRPFLLNNKQMKKRFMEKKLEGMSSSGAGGKLRPFLHRKMERFQEKMGGDEGDAESSMNSSQ